MNLYSSILSYIEEEVLFNVFLNNFVVLTRLTDFQVDKQYILLLLQDYSFHWHMIDKMCHYMRMFLAHRLSSLIAKDLVHNLQGNTKKTKKIT